MVWIYLKAEPAGFVGRLYVRYERKKEVKNVSQFLA